MKQAWCILTWVMTTTLFGQTIEWTPDQKKKNTAPVLYTEFLNNRQFLFSGINNHLYLFDLTQLKDPQMIRGLQGRPDAFDVSRNGHWLASGSIDNEFQLWKMPQGKRAGSFGEYAPGYVTGKTVLFLPDDKRFAYTEGCQFTIRDCETGALVDSIPDPENECAYVAAFTPDASKVVVGGNNGVWQYDMQAKKVTANQPLPALSVITAVQLRPDGRQLAVAGREGLVFLHPDLSLQFELKGHTDWINSLRYSPDGKYLYSCSGTIFGTDRSLRIWDTETGQCLAVLEGHTDDVNALAVSPDGDFVVTASADHTLRVWDVTHKKCALILVPVMVRNTLEVCAITPDGLISCSPEASALLQLKSNGAILQDKQYKAANKPKKIRKKFK